MASSLKPFRGDAISIYRDDIETNLDSYIYYY